MMKNTNLSMLDTDQIIKKKFDEANDADRVVLVGGEKLELSIDSDKIANAVKEGLSNFRFMPENIPTVDLQTQIQREIQIVEKNVFIPQIEIKTIEVPVIVKETEYRTIEVPVITERIITVEKPVIIKEIEFKEVYKERYYPLTMKLAAIIQAVCMVGILLINLLRK